MLTIVDQQVVYVTDVFTRVVQHCAAPHVFGWIVVVSLSSPMLRSDAVWSVSVIACSSTPCE